MSERGGPLQRRKAKKGRRRKRVSESAGGSVVTNGDILAAKKAENPWFRRGHNGGHSVNNPQPRKPDDDPPKDDPLSPAKHVGIRGRAPPKLPPSPTQPPAPMVGPVRKPIDLKRSMSFRAKMDSLCDPPMPADLFRGVPEPARAAAVRTTFPPDTAARRPEGFTPASATASAMRGSSHSPPKPLLPQAAPNQCHLSLTLKQSARQRQQSEVSAFSKFSGNAKTPSAAGVERRDLRSTSMVGTPSASERLELLRDQPPAFSAPRPISERPDTLSALKTASAQARASAAMERCVGFGPGAIGGGGGGAGSVPDNDVDSHAKRAIAASARLRAHFFSLADAAAASGGSEARGEPYPANAFAPSGGGYDMQGPVGGGGGGGGGGPAHTSFISNARAAEQAASLQSYLAASAAAAGMGASGGEASKVPIRLACAMPGFQRLQCTWAVAESFTDRA